MAAVFAAGPVQAVSLDTSYEEPAAGVRTLSIKGGGADISILAGTSSSTIGIRLFGKVPESWKQADIRATRSGDRLDLQVLGTESPARGTVSVTLTVEVRVPATVQVVEAESPRENIACSGTVREARLTTRTGDVDFRAAATESLSISSGSGNISAAMPRGNAWSIEARTRRGELSIPGWEGKEPENEDEGVSDPGAAARLSRGTKGPRYLLETKSGDIRMN